MSGGTNAQTNYPAPILGGLWTGALNAFPTTPYPNTGAAASGAFGGIGSLTNNPAYNQTSFGYNPQQTAQGANALTGAVSPLTQAGQATYNQTSPYIGRALQQGFDPQNALFNQLFQRQHEQNLANQAQAGVATTPYGAGLSTQGDQNFDIAWQQAQLANQAQAANTAGSLAGTGMNALTGGYGAAASALGAGAGTTMNQQQFQQQAIQQQIADYLSYLTGSSSNAANLENAIAQLFGTTNQQYGLANQAAANQAQINAGGLGGLGQGLGAVLGGISKFIPGL